MGSRSLSLSFKLSILFCWGLCRCNENKKKHNNNNKIRTEWTLVKELEKMNRRGGKELIILHEFCSCKNNQPKNGKSEATK